MFKGQIIANKIGHLAIEEHVKKIKEQYDILETFLKQNKFIAGDNVSRKKQIEFNLDT